MNPRTELYTAVFRELNSGQYDAYTTLPLNQPYPYIRIDEVSKNTYDTKTTKGYQFSVFVNSWSDSTSLEEIADMAQFIEHKLLKKFEIEGFHNVKQDLTAENASSTAEDGVTLRRINQEYTFIIIRKEEY